MSGKRTLRVLPLVAVMLLVTAMTAVAQITTGIVNGTVKDAQGGVIPGATVLLISESRGTRSTPATTNAQGDFVFPAVAADTYTVEVTMPSFKTMRVEKVIVGSGNRVVMSAIVLEIGGTSEIVNVTDEAPLIQAQSGERSFTIETDAVANLPIANRSFTALAQLAPGVQGTNRIGGGGGNNIMIDGVSAVDTGSNSILLQMNVESIAEVKVLTSGYQAEFGRSSGLQVTAVTKSGTNRFHGSLYDVERRSDWNENNKANILRNVAKPLVNERDWGYSLGGPIGKPGGTNKLFFFYSHEFAPRTTGGDTVSFRVPSDLERAGDFSQTRDNNGNLFTTIRDPLTGANFANSRIPASRFYSLGQTILNLYPRENVPMTAGSTFNYQAVRPIEKAQGQQPAIRVDYQPTSSLRVTGKYSGWSQTNKTFLGTMPGITESVQYRPLVFTMAFTANYTINPTTFLEMTYGASQNDLAGCGLAQGGTGPTFCTNGVPTGALSNKFDAGLGALPVLFPGAFDLNKNYYAYKVLETVQPAMWRNGQLQKLPTFTFGGRVTNAPPNVPFSGFLNKNATDDISFSVTKVAGRHTFKGGFYNTHSWKAQQQNSGATFGNYTFTNNTANPIDTGFPYANALLGIVTSYNHASTYIEGTYVYDNTEGYIQDNWKVTNRMTFDYGVRFVRQQPQYDKLGQASNFFEDRWSVGSAPLLYGVGCTTGVSCTGNNRQARNPVTGQLVGAGTTALIGTIVPGTGNEVNGLVLSGQGIVDTTYKWPLLKAAPRFGAAYDLKGDQSLVVRGGFGLYFDRPSGNSIYAQVQNPPSFKNVTVNNAFLADLNPARAAQGAPSLSVFEYESGLPSSNQWNLGLQSTLPWKTSLDVSYVGQHSWNTPTGVNINAIDIGSAFLTANQDPTQAATFFGSNTVANDQMRSFRGYGNINRQMPVGWRTFHSLQFSFQRRFSNGVSFGFNDTWNLYDKQNSAARLEHPSPGVWQYRADQAQADTLLQNKPTAHTMRGNFVWDTPDLRSDKAGLRALGYLLNDWQVSGIWSGTTGGYYSPSVGYQNGGNVNITGSPDFAPRIVVVGDTGSGCNMNDLTRQFNVAGFGAPSVGSVGLESGPNLLKGCFQQVLDLSLARTIRLGGGRQVQLRADFFNAPNLAVVTGRTANLQLTSPTNSTPNNLPYDAAGNPVGNRAVASNAANNTPGFGVATTYQAARSVQMQVRFSF